MICPVLRMCDAKVDFEYCQKVCLKIPEDAYKECEHFKKMTAGAKRPLEWQRLLIPTA